MIRESKFGNYERYQLENERLRLSVTNLGATVIGLRYCGRETVLGYDSPELYLEKDAYLGATVGRYANRIGGASFSLGGKIYELAPNEGANQLHGGPQSYNMRPWRAEPLGDEALRFTLESPDGDNGFPGNLSAAITYSLDGDCLRVDFEGVCDQDTVYAPTNHMYFDLSGRGQALEARLRVNSDELLEVRDDLIPTGRRLPTEGRFDFRQLRRVGEDYDHCFVLKGAEACTLEDGGLRLELLTDFPAVQIYTGRFLPAPHWANAGLAIEPEFFPDSPNHPEFPSTLLRAGDHFHRWAEYRFSKI